MLKLEIEKTPVHPDMVKRVPMAGEMGRVIDEPCVVYSGGKPAIVYITLAASLVSGMRFVSENVKATSNLRTRGLPQNSAVFGPVPRNPPLAQDYCRFTKAFREQRQFLPYISAYNEFLCKTYEQFFPETYGSSVSLTESSIHKDWRWLKGPYTNCNFNLNHAIPYHYDTANALGGMSNVLILKRGITGGELVCPEFGVTFSQRDGAFILFDGQSILHGVMPIQYKKHHAFPYRCSIVYYTLKALKNCLCKTEELAHAQTSMHNKNSRENAERAALLEPFREKMRRKKGKNG